MKQQDHQAERILIGFCVAAYFVSYITRINYGTVLLEIVNSEGITKMAASMAVTGSFVTYGIGQLISGWLGDRIKPRYLMFIGLMVSAGMNVCVPLFSRPAAMLVFWCINGFAQALMWPPMVRLLSDYLDQDTYKKSCVWVGWGSSVGTIFLYLFAPVCIVWKGWRSLFFLCAGCAVLFAFAWIKAIGSAEKECRRVLQGALRRQLQVPLLTMRARKRAQAWKKIPLLCKNNSLTGKNRADACDYHACNYDAGHFA